MFGPGDEEELGNGGEELGETEAEQAPEDTAGTDNRPEPEEVEEEPDLDPQEDEVA